MWISLKLFLEVSVNGKSDSWDVSTFKSIVLNVMKSTGDCLEKQTMQNGDCWIINVTFSWGVYRRLDFAINFSDEPDERISAQEVE